MKNKFVGAAIISGITTVSSLLLALLLNGFLINILYSARIDVGFLSIISLAINILETFGLSFLSAFIYCKISKLNFNAGFAILFASLTATVGKIFVYILPINSILANILFSAIAFAFAIIFTSRITKTPKQNFYENSNSELAILERKRNSAKKKLILGIVFVAVALVLECAGLVVWNISLFGLRRAYAIAGIVTIIISLPFWGVGIPFFIIGLVGTTKTNRQIAMERQKAAQNSYTQANYNHQPESTYSNAQPQQPTYDYANAQHQQSTYDYYTNTQTQQPSNMFQQTSVGGSGFVDIDWRKYAPLDAGISYNPSKDYKFHRAEGFAGSVPQTFVNRTFPKCPLCCNTDPYWNIAQHNQMSWKGNLYLFKCSRCQGVISMSMPDVTTLGNGGSGVVFNPTVGLTNLMAKSSAGKEAGAVYAVIENVGCSGVTPECMGKEFKLEQVQEMFLRM